MWRTPWVGSDSPRSSVRRAATTRRADLLAELVADAGITWIGRASDVTPVTVSLPGGGDRALVSVMPPPTVDVETLSGITARAVVVDLPSAPLLPGWRRCRCVYAVVGDPEVAC